MAGRTVPPPEANIGIRLFDRLRPLIGLGEMPVIVADEIQRQIDALPDGDGSPPASAYGVVVPPFPRCFVEADVTVPDLGLVQFGTFVEDQSAAFRAGTLSPEIVRAAPPGTHWLMVISGFMRSPLQRQICGYAGVMLLHLDASGLLLDDMDAIKIMSVARSDSPLRILPGVDLPGLAPYTLKAISAMHQRCAADKVTPLRQARRQAERQGVKQLNEYYVLRVQPRLEPRAMAEVGRPSKAQQQRREHMVRGHFRYYTPEKPLFGRTTGMIWIPAHERGDSDIGRIKKDYEV